MLELPEEVKKRVEEFDRLVNISPATLGKSFSSETFDLVLMAFERRLKGVEILSLSQSDVYDLMEFLYSAHGAGIIQGYKLMLKDATGRSW